MDRLIYVAMTGAREITRQQAAVSHNLANISTVGFKAELNVFRALPVVGEGARTRAFVLETTPGTDFTAGAIQHTGRSLDVAVHGSGWIAVQDASGQEAYTRMGDLQTSPNGVLQTGGGLDVIGDGGQIAVPPDREVLIGKDGTVSAVPTRGNRNAVEVVGRIKLANPLEADLVRGDDGLFRLRAGGVAPADANVALATGAIESSNVNPAEALVSMISLSRQFETQMRLLRTAEENHRAGDKVIAR
jgi:flagellar basal-body rod protein FlgF